VSSLLIGILGAIVASNQPAALSNVVQQSTGISVTATNAEAIEKEFKKLEDDDDAAKAEVDGWITENNKFTAAGAGIPAAELNQRIRKRLDIIQKAYEDFLQRHPNHVDARLAYASFLDDIGDEEGELAQLEKARELGPENPAVWNNLANFHGHNGGLTNAFAYYEKAIQLNPTEAVYYHNFGTTVYLFRKDAREYYHINEAQVFDKAMNLYSNAMHYDPTNFVLASDVAQSYYGIRPLRTNDALMSWTNALKVAGDEIEREGVYLHFARIKMSIGQFDQAHAHLDAVTNKFYDEIKNRLVRNLEIREHGTNSVAEPAAKSAPATNAAPKNAAGKE
jgi:tetratricopeptide (TPR) repeat protein